MAVLPQNPAANIPITPEQAKAYLRQQAWANDPALSMTLRDAERAENFQLSKAWVLTWSAAITLYESPFIQQYWAGTNVERASIPFFTVATAVNSLTPQIVNGLFSETPPFLIEERYG